jgi:hypothetical protein
MHSKSFFRRVAALAFAIGALTQLPLAHAALLDGGDIVTIEDGGAFGKSRLIRIEPVTGARTVLHDFGLGSSPFGGTFGAARGVALDSSGAIFVQDGNAGTGGRGALFRINSAGVRQLVSDFGVGANPGSQPIAPAIEASGNVLVIDPFGSPGSHGALFRVNPATGARKLLSDFGQDTLPDTELRDVAVEASGNILVVGSDRTGKGRNALFRVNPVTGSHVVLTDFGPGTNKFRFSVAVEASGSILVADSGEVGEGSAAVIRPGTLFRINPASGVRTVVSDFGQGLNPVKFAGDVVVEPSGGIVVVDGKGGPNGRGSVLRVDPVTGARKLVVPDITSGSNVPSITILGAAVAPGQVCSSLGDKSSPGTIDTDAFTFNGKKREVVSVVLKPHPAKPSLGKRARFVITKVVPGGDELTLASDTEMPNRLTAILQSDGQYQINVTQLPSSTPLVFGGNYCVSLSGTKGLPVPFASVE